MATVSTVEQVEAKPHVEAIATQPQRRSLWPSVDSNGMTLIAIATLAIATFTYLNIRIDNVGTELRTRVDTLSAEMNVRFEKLSSEQRAENREINARLDKVNERLDRLFELVAAQGRREPR